ncbi:MAG: invasion associated locus B family protein [Boseongicola sp.]|nr:invasion associated locus B family protein [Boseongicola sp.]NNL18417.1 invasion associated locus B family protein [Boseongicola sp.]
MTTVFRVLCLAGALSFPAAVLAQSTDTPETEVEAETAEVEPSEPVAGDTYVAGTFSDWELRCLRLESGRDRCQMLQLLVDQTGQAVAEVNFFAIPPGGPAEAGASVITPLETLLTANLRLAVDAGEVRQYPYSFCTVEGCIARLGFTPEEVVGFKRGATATVTIVPAQAPDQTVDLRMSLSGFTASYDELRTRAGLE